LNGAYKAYYDNGQVKVEKNYTQNVLTGPVKVFYNSGKIKRRSHHVR
ncbi:MAG: toxin-antitoxin system YwqK family antitoxin, partial [Saprospiraceae bacterium]|nr:toxin-antitoxin system YwqK family antitoxin [Saprospiraceae bacterium]